MTITDYLSRFLRAGRPIASHPHRLGHKLYISLTTYPARFKSVYLTLLSLSAQTVKPDGIILWIGHEDKEDFVKDESLQALVRECSISVGFVPNWKSYKKLIPTLLKVPDSFIVTADDDLYYWPTWLEELVSESRLNPGAVVAHRAHFLKLDGSGFPLPYREWGFLGGERSPSTFNVPTTGGGVLFPPQCFSPDASDIKLAMSLAPTSDDLWFYWHLQRLNRKVVTISKRNREVPWPLQQQGTLWAHNSICGNDLAVIKLLHRYGEVWLEQPDQNPVAMLEEQTNVSDKSTQGVSVIPSHPIVSIVIPVFNGSNFLEYAILSALQQTHKRCEVIVVNDGSSDNGATEALCRAYARNVKVIEKENGGTASALNSAIEVMNGDYFSWLSHDDFYRRDKVEAQLAYIGEDKLTIPYFNGLRMNVKTGRLARHNIPLNVLEDPFLALVATAINGLSLLIHRSFFSSLRFNPGLRTTQDYDLWFKLFLDGAKFKFQPADELVVTRLHSEQATSKLREIQLSEKRALYLKFYDWAKSSRPDAVSFVNHMMRAKGVSDEAS